MRTQHIQAMSEKNTGGPAFPVNDSHEMNNGERAVYADPGMNLRDYFAAKAMQSLIGSTTIADVARLAYVAADAMLKAREQ